MFLFKHVHVKAFFQSFHFQEHFIIYLLTLTFDQFLKNLYLGHNFWTKRDRALILHSHVYSHWKDLSAGTKMIDSLELT